MLNLNSYAGGARMWDAGELGTHRTNIVGALLSGGYEDTFSEDTDTFLSYDECDGEGVLMEVRDDSDDDDDEMVDAQQSSRKKKRLRTIFGKSKRDDGLVDVVAVYGALHLGQLSWGTDRPVRLRQAREVKIEVSKAFPVHVDGQPWEERNGATLTIKRRDCVGVLAADPASLTSLGSGRGYESVSGRVPSQGGWFWGNTLKKKNTLLPKRRALFFIKSRRLPTPGQRTAPKPDCPNSSTFVLRENSSSSRVR